MCKLPFYVGIDVSKDKLDAATNNARAKTFRHSPSGIKSLYEWTRRLSGDSTIHFCMEATGVYSQRLAISLAQIPDIRISIINPAQIAAFGKAQLRRTKTDALDAEVILNFGQSQHPPLWKLEPVALRQLQALVAQADTLRITIRRWSNRKHSQSYIPDLPEAVSTSTIAIIGLLENQLNEIEQAIADLCDSDEYLRNQTKLLCSIPGVATLTAVRLLAYGNKALTERNQKSLIAHAGLAPRHRQSGSSILGKSHIAKQGDKRLRGALYMPALVSIMHNPIIKQFYERLISKGKPPKLAITACMRKMLLIVRAIIVSQKPFNPKQICLT